MDYTLPFRIQTQRAQARQNFYADTLTVLASHYRSSHFSDSHGCNQSPCIGMSYLGGSRDKLPPLDRIIRKIGTN